MFVNQIIYEMYLIIRSTKEAKGGAAKEETAKKETLWLRR